MWSLNTTDLQKHTQLPCHSGFHRLSEADTDKVPTIVGYVIEPHAYHARSLTQRDANECHGITE